MLPPASSVLPGTSAYTTDFGPVYSDGMEWIKFLSAAQTGSMVIIGDSRIAQYSLAAGLLSSVNGTNFLAWANALLGYPYQVLNNLGLSGNRSDQFFSKNLATAISTTSEWLLIGPPGVNDISQAPYTDVNGNLVTAAGVALAVATNVKNAVIKAVGSGKKVLLCTEWGASTFTATQCAQVFQLNEYLRYIARSYPRVYLWDGTKDLWNSLGSSTQITFRSGYVGGDGTHPIVLGGYFLGKSLKAYLGAQLATDVLESIQADTYANNTQSLLVNGLFNDQSGGTISGVVLTSGAVPNGWAVGGSANTSVVITYGTDANGYGDTVTLAFTATAADSCRIGQNITVSEVALTDSLSSAIQLTVAASSSNFAVWLETIMNTESGSSNNFALNANQNSGFGSGATEAYSLTMFTPPFPFPKLGATVNLVNFRVHCDFSAAGNGTVTLSRAAMRKQLVV